MMPESVIQLEADQCVSKATHFLRRIRRADGIYGGMVQSGTTRYGDPYLRVDIDRTRYTVFDPDLMLKLADVRLVGEPIAVLWCDSWPPQGYRNVVAVLRPRSH
jgi:hypothetical protein